MRKQTGYLCLMLFFIFAQSVSASPVVCQQGEEINLKLKLVNVGDISLNDVFVTLDASSTPEWIQSKATSKVDVAAPLKLAKRPYVYVTLSFIVDRDAPLGEFGNLTLKVIERSGNHWERKISLDVLPSPKPEAFAVLQNYPNPFNPETWIPYQLAEASDVRIRIYDASGRMVRTLSLGNKEAGFYISKEDAAYWDGRNDLRETVASGVYFYHLQAGEGNAIHKMLILK